MGEGILGSSFLSHGVAQILPLTCSLPDPVVSTRDTGMTRTGPLPLRDSKLPCNRPKLDTFLTQQVQNYLYLWGHICGTHGSPQKPWYVLNLDSLNQIPIPFPDNLREKSPSTFF